MNMLTTTPRVEVMEEATHTEARTGQTTGTEARQTGALNTAGNQFRGQEDTEVGEMTAGDRDTITGDRHALMAWDFDNF